MSKNKEIFKGFRHNDKEVIILFALMKDGRLTDTKLKEIFEFRSSNSARYYRNKLEKTGIIEGYTAIVNWEKLGLNTMFMVLVEGNDNKTLHKIGRDHIFSAQEYLSEVGEMVITSTLFGPVVLKEVSVSYGKIGIITGYAASEDAAKNYSEMYLKERYPGIKTKTYILRNTTIKDFFIQKDFIKKFKSLSPPTDADIKWLERFKEKFLKRFYYRKSG